MSAPVENSSRVSFGLYEANLQTGELWKAGMRVKIQSQPFKVLTALLERPGEVVTREDLQLRLWGKDTVVDFDHSLGTAINKIREALSDSADNPRFVETLARRGYRFIAPVTVPYGTTGNGNRTALSGRETSPDPNIYDISGASAPPSSSPQSSIGARVSEQSIAIPPRTLMWGLLASLGASLLAASAYYVGSTNAKRPPLRISQVTQTGRIFPGQPAMENLPASATDGVGIFASVLENGVAVLSRISVSSGDVQPLTVPSETAAPTLGDISPDGSKLLLRSHLSRESEQALWVVPTSGGGARRLGNVLAHDATWMPDGENILYAAGNELFTIAANGEVPVSYARLPGRPFWLRWSPDSQLLRFTIIDPLTHTTSLWELPRNEKGARPVLTSLTQPATECCGSWTSDGKYYVFQSSSEGTSDLWRLNGKEASAPVRLTNGPLSYQAPVTARSGHRIFFLGLDTHAHLQRFAEDRKEFVPVPGSLANASRIAYTRDGKWVAWTDASGRLWRGRPDGSEKLQLTPDSMNVFLAQWSPDGSQLAFMGEEPGKSWQIYLIRSDGGSPARILAEDRNEADPSWSPDGNSLVFGRIPDVMGKESTSRTIQVLNLKTGKVDVLSNSEGLFSPRWSPDGRYIAALSFDQRRLMLFDTASRTWRQLYDSGVADPVWTADSRAIYFHGFMTDTQPIIRLTISDNHVDVIASLANFPTGDAADYFFCGITPENDPLVRARTSTADFYSLDLDNK